ncbi:MAG: hypothetical protein JST54_02845 [Deltaproteobacteria bacterium]|nr:hypothetical protein [Deltaproteobacteria bacterium]
MSRHALAVALLFLGCTPDLTVQDARPFAACSLDRDCVVENLTCSGCSNPVGIAQSRQQDFEELRGCWPPQTQDDCIGSCEASVCSQGLCVAVSGCNARHGAAQ